MSSLIYKLFIFAVSALSFVGNLSAAVTADSTLDKLKALQVDSTVAISVKTDSLAQTVIISTSGDDADDELDSEEMNLAVAGISNAFTTNPLKTVVRGLVAILVIACPFVFVLLLVLMILRYVTSRNRERNRLIEMSIREHYQLPEEFYRSEREYYMGPRRLSSGIIWLGFGIAYLLFWLECDMPEMASLAAIPIFVGIARIVIYLIGKRNGTQDSE